MLAGVSYTRARTVAHSLGIVADDPRLWSDTAHVRALLRRFGVHASPGESAFTSWDTLPDLALLSIKWHLEKEIPYWHWVVFWRSPNGAVVLDPKKALRTHIRRDFGRMKPKWFIKIDRSGLEMSAHLAH